MGTLKLFGSILFFLICFSISLTTLAQADPWNTPYDRFFEDPDLSPEFETHEDGTERRSVMLPGSVLLEQTRRNGRIEETMTDQSGLGAVMCAKAIYWEIKTLVDTCSDLKNERLSRLLTDGLSRIDGFIVENSIQPVSLKDVAHSDQIRLEQRLQDLGLTKEQRTIANCKKVNPGGTEFVVKMSENIVDGSDAEFHKRLDKLLSVPRVAALNPCL